MVPRDGLKTPPTRRRSRSVVIEAGDSDRLRRLEELVAQLGDGRGYAIVALPLPSPKRVHWHPSIE